MSSAPPAHQSKPSNNHRRNPHNYQGQKQPPPQQQRYVPKPSPAHAAPKPSSQPSLTAALRSSTASSSASGAGGSTSGAVGVGVGGGAATDAFVAYLPHDEAVAAGLGAQESQAVVDLLNNALAALLRTPPLQFWRQGNQILSLMERVIVPFVCFDAYVL
jgi:activating signal cointegrator complex subunit 2